MIEQGCQICGLTDHSTGQHATVQLLLSWELLVRAGLEEHVSGSFRAKIEELGAATTRHLDGEFRDAKEAFKSKRLTQAATTSTS